MRVKTGKFVFLLGFWTFLLLFLKESFPKAAYASTAQSCAMQPACVAILKAELGSTITAPAAQATTISVTTASGATTTTQAVARVAVIGNVRLAGITAFYIWNQAHNEWAQEKARERYCSIYPKDQVCLPSFTGGQGDGVVYTVGWSIKIDRPGQNNPWAQVQSPRQWVGPIVGVRCARYGNPGVNVEGIPTSEARGEIYSRGRAFSIGPADHPMYSPEDLSGYTHANITPNLNWYSDPQLGMGFQGALPVCRSKIDFVQRADGQSDTAGNLPGLAFKYWPQAKRDAAVKSLNDSDWQELSKSMPEGGLLGTGDKINASTNLLPGQSTDDPSTPQDERQPKKIPGPSYTLPPSASTAQWPGYLNIPGLTDREKYKLKQRVDRGHLTVQDVQKGKFRTIPNDPDNRKCFYTELTNHLGEEESPDHSKYATQVTGSLGDLFMMTPDGGNFATYDGAVKTGGTAKMYGETDGAVAEVKTLHSWLLKLVDGYPLVRTEPSKWSNLQQQLMFEAIVAEKCKLRYFIAFEREDVVKRFGPMLVDLLKIHYPPIRVRYIPFNRTS